VLIRLDADACVGHGRCYSLAPQVFTSDELGHCVILADRPGPEDASRADLAVRSCPEQALSADD
jgi:ferredoxin